MPKFTLKKSVIIQINNAKRVILLLFICLFFALAANGRDFYFQTLGCTEGLSQSSAISIWQDGIGRVWIGNDALNCYNGESVKVFRVSEYFKELEDSYIHALCGNDSVLFFLAENQLLYMDLNREALYHPEITTTSICFFNEKLYYVSNNTFYEYDYKSKESNPIASLSLKTSPTSIIALDEDHFWIGTYSGLYHIDRKTRGVQNICLPDESIVFLHNDFRGTVWIGTQSNRIYICDSSGKVTPVNIEDKYRRPISLPDLFCVQEDLNGAIWLGTLAGVFQMQKRTDDENTLVVKAQMVKESTVFSLFLDHQSTLWIGSYYGDVRYFNIEANDYTYFTVDEKQKASLHGVVMGVMAEDKSGNLYIATEGSGINIIRPESDVVEHLTTADGLPKDKIRDIWYDEKTNRLYISVYMEGLCYLDINTHRIHRIKEGAISTVYQRIIEKIIPYKSDLILLTQDGLFKLNKESMQISYLFDDATLREVCSGIIRTIHIDDRNVLWVSSFVRGLFTVDLNTNQIIRNYGDGLKEGSVIPSGVLRMNGDLKRGLYFTTLRSGVLSYDAQQDTFVVFNEANRQLISDICYNVAFLNDGTLAVTSNKGMTFLKMSSPLQVKSSRHVRIDPSFPLKALSVDCGLYMSPYTSQVYVGGLYGLISFHQNDLREERADYNLYLSSVMVNNKPLPLTDLKESFFAFKKIVLPHNQNTLNITFASSDYQYSHAVSYEYKLEGLDDYWTETIHNTIVYNSLRPGKYKLIIREVGNMEKQIILFVEIKSPFWMTVPALFIYFCLSLFLLWWIVRFYAARTMLRKSLEMERHELMRVEESNRNKMDFFISISNEFRTPLTLIVAQLDRLSYELPGTGKGKIEKIKRQAARLQDLIAELLDFRKMNQNNLSLSVRDYNYSDFVSEVFESFKDQASEMHMVYRLVKSPEDLHVWFDQKQMQKVFYNLLAFLFKSVEEKDSVQIHLKRKSKSALVEIIYKRNKADDALFDRLLNVLNLDASSFSDLSLLPEGAAGLAFSKGIITLHKGMLVAKKEDDVLVVTLELQMGNAHIVDSEIEESVVENAPSVSFVKDKKESFDEVGQVGFVNEEAKEFKMLLVEEDDDVRKVLKESFSLVYQVVEMRKGDQAYDYAMKELPDIILSDVDVVGMSGVELCSMLKMNKKTLHIPVVLLTSRPSEKLNLESIRCGADDYFIKPFNIEHLFLRCNMLVKNRKNILSFKPSVEESSEMATNVRDQEFLAQVNKVLEANYGNQNFDTSLWSKELGIGRTRLFDKIKAITGMTPNDYILFMKMNRSQLLLQNEGVTIAEVAYQMGFSNPAYFSKSFKKQFGITPLEFRKTL